MAAGDHLRAAALFATVEDLARPAYQATGNAATHTIKDWWTAPVAQLIATYDPQNPPADDLAGWQAQLRRDLGNDQADLLLDIGDAYDTAGQLLDDTATDLLTPPPPTFPWLKLGLALSATTLVGALAYRIARK